MNREDAFEREMDEIYEACNSGQITAAERDRQLRDLRADYRAAAHEAAQDAYERELENW